MPSLTILHVGAKGAVRKVAEYDKDGKAVVDPRSVHIKKLEVTDEHIQRAEAEHAKFDRTPRGVAITIPSNEIKANGECYSNLCPVAQAMMEQYPTARYVTADEGKACVFFQQGHVEYRFGKQGKKFMETYDAYDIGKYVGASKVKFPRPKPVTLKVKRVIDWW